MDQEVFLAHLTDALKNITTPRLYENERGFQGALLAELHKTIPGHVLPEGTVIEQEYQKRLHIHGLKIRPDIIIHEPFDETRHKSRQEGNFAVIEIKRAASQKDASDDFENLAKMMEALAYPMAVFVNIASETTYAALVPEKWKGRIACFAVFLRNGKAHVIREPA